MVIVSRDRLSLLCAYQRRQPPLSFSKVVLLEASRYIILDLTFNLKQWVDPPRADVPYLYLYLIFETSIIHL